MESQVIGYIGVGLLILLIGLGVPIGASLGAIGLVGTMVLKGFSVGFDLGGIIPFTSIASYALTIIPFFLLMGSFAMHSGITKDAYDIGNKWMGFLPGGLASATVLGCALFAATSGSSVATSGAIGRIAIGEMKKYGYDVKLACGCVAAGGLLGIMIPPSIILVLYGIMTEESVGKLLMAGFFPGFLTAAIFMFGITAIAIYKPALAPRAAGYSWHERFKSLKGGIGVVVLMLSVLGTLYAGILTPTEAGGIGAFMALVIFWLRNWKKELMMESIRDASRTTCTMFTIIVGASIFAKFLILSRVPLYTAKFMVGLDVPPLVLLGFICVIYLALGMFLDPVSILAITLPLFFPVIKMIGFNGIWFGIVVTKLIELGLITPPVGFNVYIIKSIAPEVPLEDVFRGVLIFVVLELIVLSLLILFPQIALWLPSKLT
jgi:tripartite ATP-independent transporter DctM subunit